MKGQIPEVNTIFLCKSLNNGTIFFDKRSKVEKCIEILKLNNVKYVVYILVSNGNKYYGVRMFRMKKQFLKIMEDLAWLLKE